MDDRSYVLITPARNEAGYIELTLKSVVTQTLLPKRWVIVDDGSSDSTGEIVRAYAEEHAFVRLVRRRCASGRDFGSKVCAFNAGCDCLADTEYRFLGNLDADVSFERDYFEKLLSRFAAIPNLGVAGGAICELNRGEYTPRPGNRDRTVAGAVQMFRKECFREIGGYRPLKTGGIDTVAVLEARMRGWETREFSDLRVLHHRTTSTALGGGVLSARTREGRRDYLLGNHPLYQLCKFVRRLPYRPFFVGSLVTYASYCRTALKGEPPAIPDDVYMYQRAEQIRRLKEAFRRPFRRGEKRDGVVLPGQDYSS